MHLADRAPQLRVYRRRPASTAAASRPRIAANHASIAAFRTGIAVSGETMVVPAELLLLPGTGSVTSAGAVTVAMLLIAPLADANPVRVSVTLPPLGSTGIANPACNCGTVGDTGHTAPPLAMPQLTPLTAKFGTAGSVTTAPFALAGPLLRTISE